MENNIRCNEVIKHGEVEGKQTPTTYRYDQETEENNENLNQDCWIPIGIQISGLLNTKQAPLRLQNLQGVH
jgi:hypothetical protein